MTSTVRNFVKILMYVIGIMICFCSIKTVFAEENIDTGIETQQVQEYTNQQSAELTGTTSVDLISFIEHNADEIILIMSGLVILLIFTLTFIIFQHRKNRKSLVKIAYVDSLTGIPNLNGFKNKATSIVKKNPDKNFIITKFDILNFKMINQMLGFSVGDDIIKFIPNHAHLVKLKDLEDLSVLARINADEFVSIDAFEKSPDEITIRLDTFERVLNEKLSDVIGSHRVEFRYGRYTIDHKNFDIDDAFEKANLAHRTAKTQDSGKLCDYSESLKQKAIYEIELENKMEAAIRNREFKVYLQPKYELETEIIIGAEALVRWREADGAMIFPNRFIPLFEKNGFITKLDIYMFERVCEIIRSWIDKGEEPVTVSVNFSRRHLINSDFVSELKEISDRINVPTKYLEVELTESTMFDNVDVLSNLIESLHSVGFTVSMDDFGTGYSSLGLLKDLPVDVVKIDKSFFDGNKCKVREKVVISNVIRMAKELGMHTVAEGVEYIENIELLQDVGCDIVQGYYYARPMPSEDFSLEAQRKAIHKEKGLVS